MCTPCSHSLSICDNLCIYTYAFNIWYRYTKLDNKKLSLLSHWIRVLADLLANAGSFELQMASSRARCVVLPAVAAASSSGFFEPARCVHRRPGKPTGLGLRRYLLGFRVRIFLLRVDEHNLGIGPVVCGHGTGKSHGMFLRDFSCSNW